MFTGLFSFPLTPMNETGIDEKAFVGLIKRLVSADVNGIGALGSTGNYAYLSRQERKRIAQLAVEYAEGTPLMVSIGALQTRDVLQFAEDAQQVGADAVMLAPVSYQALTSEEVFTLYETVSRNLSIPLCVYDNPGTTHFHFTDELLSQIAYLPQVHSIKIPPVADEAKDRVKNLRAVLPNHVTIGISGDASAVTGLIAGCDAWYSVLGGLFPEVALHLTRTAQAGNTQEALQLSAQLEPLWSLYQQYGSLRVIAAMAEWLGLASTPCLPLPLQPIDQAGRQQVKAFLSNSPHLLYS